MNILMLNFEFPPLGGGAANANYYLLKEFAKNNSYSIDLITSSDIPKSTTEKFSESITIHRLNVGKKDRHYWRMSELFRWSMQAYFLCRNLLKKNNYDLCHCWFTWPPGVIGYLLRKKIPYLVAMRGSDVPGYNERLKLLDSFFLKHITKAVWKKSEAVTSNSKRLMELAFRTYPVKGIKVIPNGVDLSHFNLKEEKSSDSFKFLFVGRLIVRKGVIYLLKALSELIKLDIKCTLFIVGEGPDFSRLKRFCVDEKIDQYVEFIGSVNNEIIAAVYQQANVLILPSLVESLANVVLEAMASGLPIITTDTGAAELLDDNGIMIPPHNAEKLKEAMIKLINSPELTSRYAVRSRILAEKYSWTRVAEEYVSIYEEIVQP